MPQELEHLNQPVLPLARRDFATLHADYTVHQALDSVRSQGVGEKVVYFYVTDAQNKLVGVLPTRRLLTSPLEQKLSEIMIRRVVALPQTATILDACELFVMHRFLAFPVVGEQGQMVG
ncbi:MAG TPA: CBS domain-containing protein, partial [Verrucomicrobiae bacterium]|nr:CBS domain-containing protein [Verrucomicrobiae bacterium]